MHRSVALRFPKYLLYSFFYFFALWAECSRRRPSLLLVRNAVLGLPVLLVARLRRIPCVISYTDLLSILLGGDRRFPRPLIALLRAYEVRLPAFFDLALVISPGIQQALQEAGTDPKRLSITLDGADVSLFDSRRYGSRSRAAVRRELKLKKGVRLAVFHGTLEAHHGQETLPRLVRRNAGLHFLILGGGPGFEALKNDLRAQPNATVLPFQPVEKVARYADAADLGLVPYEPNEGLDMVYTLKLLEYFALGLPVVCFALKSAQASFGKYQHLLDSADENEFSANLGQALKLPRSQALRKLIRKDFSWDAVSLRVARAIEAL
jgi:glycosyltransferase involved in cell wall biosynthesis